MKKLFWDDPYRTSNETAVETVVGHDVTVSESVFFAASGGQESDSGTIGGVSVARAACLDSTIVYTLAADTQLQPGDPVRIEIDWERRCRLMRLHFAAEIVLVIVLKEITGIEKIGAHISESKARLDFRLDEPISRYLPLFEEQANRVIDRDLPVTSAYSDETAERRYWAIEGFGSLPCGGTHIRSTGEVGEVRLSRRNTGRGKERIEIVLCDG